VRCRVELRDRDEAGSVAKKLLVNGYITQITEREKIDDEEAMFRYEKVLVSTKKVPRLLSFYLSLSSFSPSSSSFVCFIAIRS
jgi:hypothetical protein